MLDGLDDFARLRGLEGSGDDDARVARTELDQRPATRARQV